MNFSELDTTQSLKSKDFQDRLISEIFQVLNSKESDIVQKRFALQNYKKHTLEQIGQEYGITRERVRQIEKNALTKLSRIASKTSMVKVIDIACKCMHESHYFATEKQLTALVINETGGLFIENSNLISLSFAINPTFEIIKKSKFSRKSWFETKKINKKIIDKTISISENLLKDSETVVIANDLLNEVQQKLKIEQKISISKNSIGSILSSSKKIKKIEEGYGLTTWRSVMPKSIRDKSLIVLNRINKPLHFRKIAKLIEDSKFDKKKVTIQAVHNELIRYEDFVLVGRGIYALKEWGFQEGTVKDVITEILKASGPLNKTKIIEEVLKRRHVKIGTISLNLQKYPEFKRVGRAVYSLD
jgi:hypothetical protein